MFDHGRHFIISFEYYTFIALDFVIISRDENNITMESLILI